MRWTTELKSPLRYRRQLERMHARYQGKKRLYDLVQDDVRLAEMVHDKRRIAKMVARAVADGSYRLSPVHVKWVELDKPRELYSFTALDFLVHTVIGELLAQTLEPTLSPNLWSYRAKYSTWRVVRKLAGLARKHRTGKTPRQRGLFVLRADVRQYIERVPVDPASALWPELQAVTGLDRASPQWALLQEIVRPLIVDEEGVESTRRIGLPMGSPTATIILNFYLCPLDAALDALGGALYCRFGDDIAFADEDPDNVRKAAQVIDEVLAQRRLALNPKKKKMVFWNGAARPVADWQGASEVVFLGCGVRFDGTIGLPTAKWREVLSDVKQRLRQSAALLVGETLESRASALAAVCNEVFDPSSELAHPHARMVRRLVTSREQLAELDRLVALALAETLTGVSGPRAFRDLSQKRLRDLGLQSLVHLRNQD